MKTDARLKPLEREQKVEIANVSHLGAGEGEEAGA